MEKPFPTLKTPRLYLRPFSIEDAPDISRLAGDREVAAMTARIPHPYTVKMAEEFLEKLQERMDKGETVVFALTLAGTGELLGAVGLEINKNHDRAEMGFWIGKPYWGKGYCTEGAGAVLSFGFDILGLNRIFAQRFRANIASGKVLQKIGMQHEGTLRRHFKKWGEYQDLEVYAILRSEWRRGELEAFD